MKKRDPEMSARLVEEIFRLGYTQTELAKMLGCNYNSVTRWLNNGDVPYGYYMKRLYEVGADVVYILTGERTRGGDINARP